MDCLNHVLTLHKVSERVIVALRSARKYAIATAFRLLQVPDRRWWQWRSECMVHSRVDHVARRWCHTTGHGERSRSQLHFQLGGPENVQILAVNLLAVNVFLPVSTSSIFHFSLNLVFLK